MRDGTLLSCDVYRPAVVEPVPALLCRTIYDKQAERYVEWALRFAAAGYAAIVQDCRGRFASEGRWRPYVDEAADGFDSLAWVGEQPWCNGSVGGFGSSYSGFTQVLAAPLGSRHLKAVLPIANQEDNFGHIWCDGVLQLQTAVNFGSIGRRTIHRTAAQRLDLTELYRRLPLQTALDGLTDTGAYREFLSHPTFDDYWRATSMKGRYAQVSVPAYFITGWFDNLVHEQFKCFAGWRNEAAPEARVLTRLLVGPWTHSGLGARQCGGVDFGADAAVDLPGEHVRWYDARLRGVAGGIDDEPPVRIFVMGDDRWRAEDDWPLARARPTSFYLRSGGAAASELGDGHMSLEAPEDCSPDRFVYDPADPVPTWGGQSIMIDLTGPRDRREIEVRPDVAVYTTAPLEHRLEVTGSPHVELFAATSATDTDFTATLVDLRPDGEARCVCEGIVRARYRESLEQPTPVVPDAVYAYRIELWETSYAFAPGHCIRLEVSSSNFPRFDRNLNTGGTIGGEASFHAARQLVFHDREHPTRLVLPVVPATGD